MRDIQQIISLPPPPPTADEIVDRALDEAQEAMDRLGPDATPLQRAVAIAELGFPCWFAEQRDREFTPINRGGGVAHQHKFRTTVSIEKLTRSEAGNTIIFEIELPNGKVFPAVYDRQFRRCGPWVQHVQVRLGR